MINKQRIIKLIREGSSDLKKQTQNMMNTKGVEFTARVVGGIQNVAKILDLDLEDNDTQCMLVKNFIYHFKIEGIDISFLEIRNSVNGKKIIKVYFTTYDNARNINSWYDRTISDYLNNSNLFPFKVGPVWEPVFANRGIKIFLESETINNEEELNEIREQELTEKCWPGYTQKGMKTMFGKRYPNCVKKNKK